MPSRTSSNCTSNAQSEAGVGPGPDLVGRLQGAHPGVEAAVDDAVQIPSVEGGPDRLGCGPVRHDIDVGVGAAAELTEMQVQRPAAADRPRVIGAVEDRYDLMEVVSHLDLGHLPIVAGTTSSLIGQLPRPFPSISVTGDTYFERRNMTTYSDRQTEVVRTRHIHLASIAGAVMLWLGLTLSLTFVGMIVGIPLALAGLGLLTTPHPH